jgi:hypothetical protein
MIESAFAAAGRDVNPYAVFLRSLPYNFHCWFTLVLLGAVIASRWNPGPMAGFERAAQARPAVVVDDDAGGGSTASAFVPLAVLLVAFFGGFYVLGNEGPLLPVTREKIVTGFGSDAGPLVMVLAGLVATLAAVLLFPARRFGAAGTAFVGGPGHGRVDRGVGRARRGAVVAAAGHLPDGGGGLLRHGHFVGHHGHPLSPGHSRGGRSRDGTGTGDLPARDRGGGVQRGRVRGPLLALQRHDHRLVHLLRGGAP